MVIPFSCTRQIYATYHLLWKYGGLIPVIANILQDAMHLLVRYVLAFTSGHWLPLAI